MSGIIQPQAEVGLILIISWVKNQENIIFPLQITPEHLGSIPGKVFYKKAFLLIAQIQPMLFVFAQLSFVYLEFGCKHKTAHY
jgi:hypothetical protein